jgi:hypothetical protein
MSIVPDPLEPRLFDLASRIQKERNRTNKILKGVPSQEIVQQDILLDDSIMAEYMKAHMLQ